MFRPVVLVSVIAMLIAGGMPPTAVAAGPGTLCGVVTNAAGWPIAGALVAWTVTDESVLSFDTGSYDETDSQGAFEIPYVADWGDAAFNLAVVAPPTEGVVYAPFKLDVRPDTDADRVTACPAGTSGWRYDVEVVAPAQSLLQVNVTDAITAARIPGATVAVGPHAFESDANGIARTGCATAAGTAALVVSAPNYVPAVLQAPCVGENQATFFQAALWRKPVTILASVTHDPAGTTAASIVLPFDGADVRVQEYPAELGAFNRSRADCIFGSAGLQGLVDAPAAAPLDPASPYSCAAISNAAGIATLRLPWSAAGQYVMLASAPGYGRVQPTTIRASDAEVAIPPSAQRPPVSADLNTANAQASSLQAIGNRYVWFNLEAVAFALSETVRDFAGQPIANANLEFTGPALIRATTASDGKFSVVLPAGIYTLNITAANRALRTCTLTVQTTSTGVQVSGLAPTYCWTLIAAGKAGLSGRAVDGNTSIALRGASACVGASPCATSNQTGAFSMEVPAGNAYTIAVSNGTMWTPADVARAAASPGSIFDIGTVKLPRASRCVAVDLVDAGANFDVVVRWGGAIVAQGLTNASGRFSAQLPWTNDPTVDSTTYDLAPYSVAAWRDRVSPWMRANNATLAVEPGPLCQTFSTPIAAEELVAVAINLTDNSQKLPIAALVSASPDITSAACGNCSTAIAANTNGTLYLGANHTFMLCAHAAGYNVTCLERWRPVPELALPMRVRYPTVTVTTRDAHTGQLIADALVTATTTVEVGTPPPTLPLCAQVSEVCTATGGVATLRLGSMWYKICSEGNATVYQPRCTKIRVDPPGGVAITFDLPRQYKALTLAATDAHTGSPLQGAKMFFRNTSGFICDPTPGTDFACESSASSAAGSATGLAVPVTFPGEGCLSVDPIVYALNPAQSGTLANTLRYDQADVSDGWSCIDVFNATNSSTVAFELLRAPDAPITASVRSALDGSVPAGVRVTAALHRLPNPAFECAPASSTSNHTFPHCYGMVLGSDGNFSMRLPKAGALPYVWTVTVEADGYYPETIEAVTPGGALGEILLWPQNFTMNITLGFMEPGGSPGSCLGDGPRQFRLTVVHLDTQSTLRVPFDTAKSCNASVEIAEWMHTSVRLYGANTPVPLGKTMDTFAFQYSGDNYYIADVKQAGPAQRNVTLVATDPEATPAPPAIAAVAYSGRLADADRVTTGLPIDMLGAPAGLVVATRVGEPCYGVTSAAAALSGPDGSFTLQLPCAGSYTIAVTPLGGGAMPFYTAPTGIAIDSSNATQGLNISLPRVRLSLVLAVVIDPAAAAQPPDVVVNFAGIDTATRANATSANYLARSPALPWGLYSVSPKAPWRTVTNGAIPALTPEVGLLSTSMVALGAPSSSVPSIAILILSPPPAGP